MSFRGELSRYVEGLWWRAAPPPPPLRLLEKIYAPISRRHLQKRATAAVNPPLPMISVGNITVGGSGKTPFVIWLAAGLKAAGYRPVVLCRGDGGDGASPRTVTAHDRPEVVGDEALLLAETCDCPVISGRDRVAASRMAQQLGDIIILDDGFQYRQLQRICDIVLIPAEGIGNGHLIPAGPLREPLSALHRADLIVRTGAPCPAPLTTGKEWRWSSIAAPPVDLTGIAITPPATCMAVTGIARADRFINALQQQGIDVADQRLFPDHHRFTAAEVEGFAASSFPIVITAKDAVKIRPAWPDGKPLWVLPLQAQAEAGLLESILAACPERAAGLSRTATGC